MPIRPGIVKHGQSGRLAQAAMNYIRCPEKAMSDAGITTDIQAYNDGSWQFQTRNRVAK